MTSPILGTLEKYFQEDMYVLLMEQDAMSELRRKTFYLTFSLASFSIKWEKHFKTS